MKTTRVQKTSLVFQDDGCSRFVSSQFLNTFLIWLTSCALFGDSKKNFGFNFMTRLWKLCKYWNTSSSWALDWRVSVTAGYISTTHNNLVAVLAVLLCLISCNINETGDSKLLSYKWGFMFDAYVCIIFCPHICDS